MSSSPIFKDIESALPLIEEWKGKKNNIGFTNGCFDLFHKGHVEYLQKSKACSDKLIVGLNSDSSVEKLKGKDRPIQDQKSRASILAAMRSVDMVIIFNEETPVQIIKALSPDSIIKGGDYDKDEMIGREHVQSYGGEIIIIPFEEGYSSSRIIDKIKSI